jgi:hypothetical protein
VTLTSYNTFINNLADLTITGVKRYFDGPPAGVETADLPCAFPRAVEGEEGPLTVQASGGWPTFRGQLVVIVEPTAQDTSPLNHAKVVDLVDAISTSLRAITPTNAKMLGRGPINWTVTLSSNEVVGERQYWALVTTVEGHG